MRTITPNNITQSAILNGLLQKHRRFQIFLDTLAAEPIEPAVVDVLIQIRQFNVDCISKYSDLIAKSDIHITPRGHSMLKGIHHDAVSTEYATILNNINKHLSLLLPEYRKALSSRALKGFPRVIIGNNHEKIALMKDNLLHPIQEAYYA